MAKLETCLFVAGIVFVPGCSDRTDDSAARTVSTHVLKPTVSPQVAFQTVLDGLKAAKPVVCWDFLTADQQASINKAVRELANAMDREVWDSTVGNLKKLVRVVETKKDFVLDSPLWRASGLKMADVKARWEPTVKIVKTIVESELVDLHAMKGFDGRKFLDGTGATLYAQTRALFRSMKDDPFKRIEELKVSLRTSTDQTATVVFQSTDPKAKPIEVMLGVSQGKWVALQISVVVAVGVQRLASHQTLFKTYCLADWKDQYLADMNRLRKALDQLETAKTSDDFQSILGREIFPLLLQKAAQFRKGPSKPRGLKSWSYDRKSTTAMVLFEGRHSPDEPALGALTARFNRIVPPPESVTFPQIVEGMTLVLVDPVEDINLLAKTAEPGQIVQIDAKRKTLVLRLPSPAAGDKAATSAEGLPKPAPAAK